MLRCPVRYFEGSTLKWLFFSAVLPAQVPVGKNRHWLTLVAASVFLSDYVEHKAVEQQAG